MPFETRQHEGSDPALTPAVAVSAGPWSRRLLGGVDRRVAVVAILVAVGLISGLTWNLIATQSKARASLDDSIQRRAALTADLISSAFMSARTPAVAQAQFGGSWDSATLRLEPHPDYRESFRGTLERDGRRAQVAGDLEDGEFTLEESSDGVRIAATWLGDLVEGSCGREIRGTWTREGETAGLTFVLRKR